MAGFAAWAALSLLALVGGAFTAIASGFATATSTLLVVLIFVAVLLVIAIGFRSRRVAGFLLLLAIFVGGLVLATSLVHPLTV